jgi:beta-glucosidase
MHEIYLWPFASSVAAGVGSVMCSFNQLNGTPACQNDKTQNKLLKGELEYMGNIMSDWGATKTGVESALGGLDIDMPGDDGLMGFALAPAVLNGTVPQARIDDMITRIIAPYYLLAQDQGYPPVDPDRNVIQDNDKINHLLASAGMILLKNNNNVLPLNVTSDTCLYVYGEAAGPSNGGFRPGGSSQQKGAIYQGGGSGFVIPSYALDPLSALMSKGRDAHLQIRYVTNQNDYNAINESFHGHGCENPKCLVFISAWSSEGYDRSDLHALDNGDKLVEIVASNCLNTVVIVNSVSQLNLEAWIDHPNVKSVLWSGMPGSEYGSALLDILFGDYNPGGKLVFTLAKNDSDYGTDISPTYESNYTEGVFLDYRHFDQEKITPRYYFGYGLSYTNFTFAQLHILKARSNQQRRIRSYENFGSSGLYDPVYEIKFTVTNIGNVNGSEVPQLYLGFPAEAQEPPKVLRGFERVYLGAGESKQVTLALTQKDISYWNVVNQKWTAAPGDYTVWISTSANNADVKLQGSFHI